jgi:hypothetical protein
MGAGVYAREKNKIQVHIEGSSGAGSSAGAAESSSRAAGSAVAPAAPVLASSVPVFLGSSYLVQNFKAGQLGFVKIEAGAAGGGGGGGGGGMGGGLRRLLDSHNLTVQVCGLFCGNLLGLRAAQRQ